MYINFMKSLMQKIKYYDTKATNPFIKGDLKHDNQKTIYEQTYIWVENQKDE